MSNTTTTTAPIPATATVVREVYKTRGFKVPEVALASLLGKDGKGTKVRGRIHPAAQQALIEAFPGEFVAVDLGNRDAEGNPIVRKTPVKVATLVEVPRVNAKGRALASTVMTRAEVLALAGEPADKRGALGKAVLAKAGAAHVKSGAKVRKA